MEKTELTIMERQATVNIGMIGHVAHGKSTLVRTISSISTSKSKKEKERNITIKLGYANAKIYKCPFCPRPQCYSSTKSNINNKICKYCGEDAKLIRHISFVDCPGHDILMSTMLNGISVMDGAILVISAKEPCPQPQTVEHLAAINSMNMKNLLIVQNKIDLVEKTKCDTHHSQIKEFIHDTAASNSPIIPISAVKGLNIDVCLEYIVKSVPVPTRNVDDNVEMIIIRSFDVNKPGVQIDNIVGGVIGGSIIKGMLRLGDKVEIRPGIMIDNHEDGIQCHPIITRVTSLKAEDNSMPFAVPGGLIGVGTLIDPFYCKGDRLVGQVLGKLGHMPHIYITLEINYILLKDIVQKGDIRVSISKIKKNEHMIVTIGSSTTEGTIYSTKHDLFKIRLSLPICVDIGSKVALSRRMMNHWRLVGHGKILNGTKVNII